MYQVWSYVLQFYKKWKVFIINGTGRFTPEGLEDCPETCNLLQNIPGLFHATFSTLEPGKYVPPHEGPYRGYIRYHLCLRAPENNPPYIRVHDQYHTWKAGNAVLFDDTWEHEVYNEASEERTVMMVDVMRPMPWFPTLVNKFIRDFIIRPFYGLKTMRMQTRTLNQLAKTEDKVHAWFGISRLPYCLTFSKRYCYMQRSERSGALNTRLLIQRRVDRG